MEVGAQNNTVEEAKNAMKPLAEMLYRLLSGKNLIKEIKNICRTTSKIIFLLFLFEHETVCIEF